jgi:hypothetical protein
MNNNMNIDTVHSDTSIAQIVRASIVRAKASKYHHFQVQISFIVHVFYFVDKKELRSRPP